MKLFPTLSYNWPRGLRTLATGAGMLLAGASMLAGLSKPAHAAPGLGIRYGTADNDLSQQSGLNSWLGAPILYRTTFCDVTTWSQWDNGPWFLSTTQQWLNQGANYREVIGLGLVPNNDAGNFADVYNGLHDQQYKNFGQKLTNAGVVSKVIIRLGWEFNQPSTGQANNWYAWGVGSNPTGYAKAFHRAVQMMRTTAPGLKICWNPNLGGSQNWQACWPTDNSGVAQNGDVDYVGLDVYDFYNSSGWSQLLNSTPGLTEIRNFAASKGKPECYPEWGLVSPGGSGHGDDPGFITNMNNFFNSGSNVAFQAYWNSTCCNTLALYPLNSTTTNSAALYKTYFGASAGSGNTHAGTWAAKIVKTATPTYQNLYQTVNCATNTNYVASIWVKGTGSIQLKVWYGNWGSQAALISCPASSTWTKYTTPVINSGANTQLTFDMTDSTGTAGTLYMDDAFMGISGGTNLLANPGYESGNVNWGVDAMYSILQNP